MKKLIPLLIFILTLTLFAACSDDAPEPNADFGMVSTRSYLPSPYDAVAIEDCKGDTNFVIIDEWYPNYSDDVYGNYKKWGVDEKENPNEDALTLHVHASMADLNFAFTSLLVDGVEVIDNISSDDILVFPDGIMIAIPFPLHASGTHNLVYTFHGLLDGSTHTVSHTLTIPEPTESKFDFLSPDITEGSTRIIPLGEDATIFRIAALCRTNDGTQPYQDLLATRLEKNVNGHWVDAPAVPGGYSAVTALSDEDAENPFYSPAGYYVPDPLTGELVTNIFCGTSEIYLDDVNSVYRLTMEFCENPDGSGERWTLTFNLAASKLG